MPAPDASPDPVLETAKRASTLQLLFRCGRLANEQAIALLRTRTGLPLRTSHTALLPHLDLEGTRLTELARRMQVSKQAVLQLVIEMEGLGMLERVPDPEDGRARLVRFTTTGRDGLFVGLATLGALEAQYAKVIGSERFAALHEALLALLPLLDAEGGSVVSE